MIERSVRMWDTFEGKIIPCVGLVTLCTILCFCPGEESFARMHAHMRALTTHSESQEGRGRAGAADAGIPADAAAGGAPTGTLSG
eukprot:11432854-Alexandrium_andersonii.AAC.1